MYDKSVALRIFSVSANTIKIRDIIVYPSGASGFAGEFGMTKPTGESSDELIQRLYERVDQLTKVAEVVHGNDNCSGTMSLDDDKKNNITRLATSEFSFYTQQPLSIDEFESLQKQIVSLAKTKPENIHLALASFAVMNDDSTVMNVVAHVECGENPQLTLQVKNYPSEVDPNYYTQDNVKLQNHGCYNTLSRGLSIEGREIPFTHSTVRVSKTASGECFYNATEICLDHDFAVAKSDLLTQMKRESVKQAQLGEMRLPHQTSHLVVSGTIPLRSNNCIGTVSQSDATESPKLYANVHYGVDDSQIPLFGGQQIASFPEVRACEKSHTSELYADLSTHYRTEIENSKTNWSTSHETQQLQAQSFIVDTTLLSMPIIGAHRKSPADDTQKKIDWSQVENDWRTTSAIPWAYNFQNSTNDMSYSPTNTGPTFSTPWQTVDEGDMPENSYDTNHFQGGGWSELNNQQQLQEKVRHREHRTTESTKSDNKSSCFCDFKSQFKAQTHHTEPAINQDEDCQSDIKLTGSK
jgi:hypothetical protein